MNPRNWLGLLLSGSIALTGCVRPEPLPPLPPLPGPRPSAPEQRPAGELIVAGLRYPVRLPVVNFDAARGYDAHATAASVLPVADAPSGARYRPGRNLAAKEAVYGQKLADVQQLVDLVVVHYDACGTSRRCFEVLHEVRGLSCHFLVDVDGTIYQTLDLADTAWHAGPVNARSIGIEVAHVGAEPPTATEASERWYREGPDGVRLVAPPELRPTGWPLAFVARPARPERVWGRVQGQTLVQYDFTPEQYASLGALVGELCGLFPRVTCDVPRDARGAVRDSVLSDAEIASLAGICGHWHVGGHKVDPGPAFDWDRLLDLANRE